MSEKFQLRKFKFHIAAGILLLTAGAVGFIAYRIISPGREAASYLVAVNDLTVGKTTEAELLKRDAFQKAEEHCTQGECVYYMVAENKFLSQFHLAPRMYMSTAVFVHEGLVSGVVVYTRLKGQPGISLRQRSQLSAACSTDPCVGRMMRVNKASGITVDFSSNSALRNQMQAAVNTSCFSQLHGCQSLSELIPIAKTMNLEPAISASMK